MRLLQLTKEAGRSATLTFVVKGGKTRAKLEIDLDSERAPPSSSTPAAPAPRPRRRRRRQARGASQQGAPSGSPPPSFQEGEAGGSPQPPQRPLKHLAAAPDGRQVLLQVGRPAAMLSFASLNTDGPPPSLPPREKKREKREKERKREKRREKERKREKKREKERKRCPGSTIINLHSIRKKKN